MPACRFYFIAVLGGLIGGGYWSLVDVAQAQSLSATAAPSQMVPYGAPATYPSTDPSAANNYSYPATTVYGSAAPSTPPSPYASVAANPRLAQVPADLGVVSAPPTTNDFSAFQAPAAPAASSDTPTFNSNTFSESLPLSNEPWTWQLLPSGFLYKSYLAGIRESRIATEWAHDRNGGWLWQPTIGGRAGLIRFGTDSEIWPQGWQFDVEGACFPRLFTDSGDMISHDYRIGAPLTTRQGPWEAKFGYYHYCSHIADEYLEAHDPFFPRINYVRNELIAGLAFYLNPSLRIYGEAGWAFQTDGGAEPWAFQFGLGFSSPEPTGFRGAPFFAINGHLREEYNFSGSVTVQAGWQWRGRTGHLWRIGMEYFNGLSEQAQFYNKFEEQYGMGLWYDY
jgi:hypothetical protein